MGTSVAWGILLGMSAGLLLTGWAIGGKLVGPRFRKDLCFDDAEIIEARAPALTPLDPRAAG